MQCNRLGFHMLGKMSQFTSQWDPRVYPRGGGGGHENVKSTYTYSAYPIKSGWFVLM